MTDDRLPRRTRPRTSVEALAATEMEMAFTLTRAVRGCDPSLQIVGHCTRVAALSSWLAAELDVAEEDRAVLRLAASLHELGMVAVPPSLLDSPSPLTEEELRQVRAQAEIGANIVRLSHGARAARLVRHQYANYGELRDEYAGDEDDLLLAGILRVADVFDAMCHPRPYQSGLTDEYRSHVLRTGTGTKFHPRVTRLMLREAN